MIKLTNLIVYNFEGAVRGARNPMNSWEQSDSDFSTSDIKLGNKDLALLSKLSKAGPDHGKFLRQIFVSVDIEAPLYWWKEMDTYKVGTVANSCSTMHKIHSRDLTLDDFSHDKMNKQSTAMLNMIIDCINGYRRNFVQSGNKDDWWQMVQLLPSSYNQKRTWTANYAVLKNIWNSRHNHKLDEWKEFCSWIKNCITYSKELIICEE